MGTRPAVPAIYTTIHDNEMAPPLSASPSLASFDSAASGSSAGRNLESERLRYLLHASHEDLGLERRQFEQDKNVMEQRFAEREWRLQQQFDGERQIYEQRIRQYELRIEELEQERYGQGSSAPRRR
jgi:hypothetical protein